MLYNGKSGQVTLEYFVVFAVVTLTVILGFEAFEGGIRRAVADFMAAAARELATEGIEQPVAGIPSGPGTTSPTSLPQGEGEGGNG